MEYKQEFLKYLEARGYRTHTITMTGFYLGEFYSYMLRNQRERVDDITPDFLYEYKRYVFKLVSARTGRKLSQSTIRISLTAVKQYFDYVAKKGYILINPAHDLGAPSNIRIYPRDVPTETEMQKILLRPDMSTAVGVRDRAILELMYSTGTRRRETVNLNIFDVDRERGVVRIHKGKGGKDRIVPLGEAAGGYVERYIREVRPRFVEYRKCGRKRETVLVEPALFLTENGKRLGYATLHTQIKKYAREALNGKRLSSHGIRHACATHMVRNGANIRVVQELLGHNDITTTQIYSRITLEDLKEVCRRCFPKRKEF